MSPSIVIRNSEDNHFQIRSQLLGGNSETFVSRFPLRKFCDLKETALEDKIFRSATGKAVLKA
jgi:hypothetical protein